MKTLFFVNYKTSGFITCKLKSTTTHLNYQFRKIEKQISQFCALFFFNQTKL